MISARDALERLRAGNRRFVSDVRAGDALTNQTRRQALVAGQEPFAIILGCSDSRVPAEIVFDQGLGDLLSLIHIYLGTNLGSIRIDAYGKPLNYLVGGAYGQGAPAVFNLTTDVIEPGSGRLKEVFLGASKSLARSDLTVVADYLDLSGTRRVTLTVN